MPQTIGLIAAMPEEIKPLLKKIGRFSKDRYAGFNLYRFSLGSRQFCLIESGMGARRAAAATRALIQTCSPDRIVSFGFAGAVTGGLTVGDVVIANRILDYENEGGSTHEGSADGAEPALTQPQLPDTGRYRAASAAFITAQHILNKHEVADGLPSGSGEYVLDMETAAVVAEAREAGLSAMAIRAISDAADEELGFSIDEFTDETMTVRPWRVMTTIARKPWIIPQMIRLAGNVKRAGDTLSDALLDILEDVPSHP